MEGDKQKKPKGKQGSRCDKAETVDETHSEEESYENNGDANEKEASPGMQVIYDEIRALRSDLKSEMSEFRHSFRSDIKKELNEFKEEFNRKLREATGELQATIARVGEAEQHFRH